MKKILALIFSLVAVFSVATACATTENVGSSGGESGGQESVLPGDSTDGDNDGGDNGGATVVPPITDGGNFDGGDY